MRIADDYDEISHCNKCGFCQVACPVFRSTGHESGVARGRLSLMRAMIEGRLEWGPELEGPLFDCLLCGACTSNCFSAIPTPDLLVKARAEYLDRIGRKSVHRLLFEYLLPYPRRLHLAARAVAMGKNIGMAETADALGLLRIFGRDFVLAQGIIEAFPKRALREKLRPGIYAGQAKGQKIAYFVGCGIDIIQQGAGLATFDLLTRMGRSVQVFDNCCCGMPAWSYGDVNVAQRMALKNLQILTASDADIIVTDCSSCAAFLKKYPEILPAGHPLHKLARKVSARIMDFVEWATTEQIAEVAPRAAGIVTYHDPCHASRGQGLTEAPREILKGIPEIDYVEMAEADWCCGGAGAYALSHYHLACSVLNRKMENFKTTGAHILVTSCPACMIQLSYGIRKHGLAARVCHVSELLTAQWRRPWRFNRQ